MRKRTNNLKTESIAYVKKLPTELIVGFLLGTIPILEYSSTEKEIDDAFSMLLAPEALIKHYFTLLIPYLLVCALKFALRFRSDAAVESFRFIYKIFAEVGASFLTMLRTGLGALIGFYAVVLFKNTVQLLPNQHLDVIGYIIMTLMFSGALSILHDFLEAAGKNIDNKNPIKLGSRLKY
ncbi:hypothetical protein ALP86_03003 [Pseudomonas amygdali pv. mori]|nr:hypothetical protein [Pseudomonas amygdali]RMQ42017.1 hypothetical protein ALQ05_03451 [Pseudomonas amygdali pv. mori]RMR44195.1 hypothetical protein ALP86_03003 [Pseudomonas amygdali pv. mori]